MLLPYYRNFNEKHRFFKASKSVNQNKINTTAAFDKWYDNFSRAYNHPTARFDFFFRGMKEARYKLFNSAQREWLLHDIGTWGSGDNYLSFIRSLIDEAKKQQMFEKVLNYFQINYDSEADFPILSILQHYGAPTPLMDWSYRLDVALYFATENVNTLNASEEIDGYFSVYMIKKKSQEGGLKNVFDYSRGQFPHLNIFQQYKFSANSKTNFVCYLSDFENNQEKSPVTKSLISSQRQTLTQRPLTTYYNHNIIPQEGLFIFNPYPDKPLEECFSQGSRTSAIEKVGRLNLAPFHCYNIRKDLADYIRRKIMFKGVDNAYVYPQLENFAKKVKESVLNQTIKIPPPKTPAVKKKSKKK